jgi:D-alanyl-lipoteichoic acid acyltransferase DltB (MBOAT superfamily)
MTSGPLVLEIILYLAVAHVILRWLRGTVRDVSFASINVGACFYLFLDFHHGFKATMFGIYLAMVLVMYVAMRTLSDKGGWRTGVAFLCPIFFLVIVRYMPPATAGGVIGFLHGTYKDTSSGSLAPYLIGLSYLAFRCSYLVLEVRNGTVPKPGLWRYLGFAFFLPTMPVGPINNYSHHERGFALNAPPIDYALAGMRVLVGAVKYLFLGTLCNQLSYSGLLLDDHYHPVIDLPIACVFFYLFLYCNFSGFCDMAIGASALIGIPVRENFANPFAARNIRDFWNRWHITLSHWMRDVVFSPLSKKLARVMGVNEAVAVTILLVFLLVGIWHGVGWNYAVYGLIHGVGVASNHYYTLGLKKWLGRDGFKAYNANPYIHGAAVAITFTYVAASNFFFANTFPEMRQIFSSLKWQW